MKDKAEIAGRAPIEDKVAMLLVMVVRQGITAIHVGDKIIPIKH